MEIKKYHKNCILIKRLLSIEEQINLWKQVINLTCHFQETQTKNAKSNFRKIINMRCTTKKWKNKVPQIFTNIIDKTCEIASKESQSIPSSFNPEYITTFKYPLKNGKYTGDTDKNGKWVMLISLAQTCLFFIQKGNKTKTKQEFKFESGDCLIFDASAKAKIYHGMNIYIYISSIMFGLTLDFNFIIKYKV